MILAPVDWLGILAGTLTAISFIPLVLRIVRTHSAADVSWGMLSVFATGTTLWIVWGALQPAIPVIIANGLTLILTVVVLWLKWRYSPRGRSRLFEDSIQGARTQGPRSLSNY